MKSRSFNLFVIFALFLSLLGGAVTVIPVHAAGIVVNNNGDTVADDGVCTLREAITAANTDTSSGAIVGECAAGIGADTITFAGNYTITLTGSQLPAVTSEIIITGNGVANTIIQAHANPNTATYRVFAVVVGGDLTLDGLTVRHGHCRGTTCEGVFDVGGGVYNQGNLSLINAAFSGNNANIGGGVYNEGIATVTNSSFIANIAGLDGGGIGNIGTLTVIKSNFSANSGINGAGIASARIVSAGIATVASSTFSNNNASDRGGGIANGGTLTVTNTTFKGNSASQGGGIINLADSGLGLNNANATISNSTFSGNSATSGNGGGIYTHASNAGSTANTTVINSTIIGNSADLGGGIAAETLNAGGEIAIITLRNSIIYGNIGGTAPNCITTNTGASLTGDANNLFHSTDGVCPIGASDVTSNLVVNSIVSGLADNGGPTQTHALVSGSPAIDAGNATTCANSPVSNKDQRGVTRPQGAGCDIGAYETGPIIPIVTASNPSASAVLTSLNTINVTFNQDMLNDGTDKAANYKPNYILVERGANGSFDTTSCNGGVVSDDSPQTINTASYSNNGGVYIATLTFNSLAAGTYRLFVCGTTSVWSVAGLELNNGANDATVDFTVSTGTAAATSRTGKTDASSLPKTGFAPGKVTSLPAQPATLEYSKLGDLWLEIPSLNVQSTIVGVPQNADKTWSVDWLGNDTGWLNGTAFPTWTGNSVLTAHVTNASGLAGPFAALKSLKYGDQIIVHTGGVKYVYEVRETKLSRPYATSYAFESKSDASYITLVTCSGYNPLNESYLFRRVVRAVLVSTVSE
jgi:LPXTG-site transpeptidase (sortase) family protein